MPRYETSNFRLQQRTLQLHIVVTQASQGPSHVIMQHARAPPFRMRRDAAAYTPFCEQFELSVVEWFACRHAAHLREARLIEQYETRGAAGYNHLNGAPAFSQHFWVQHRRGNL